MSDKPKFKLVDKADSLIFERRLKQLYEYRVKRDGEAWQRILADDLNSLLDLTKSEYLRNGDGKIVSSALAVVNRVVNFENLKYVDGVCDES